MTFIPSLIATSQEEQSKMVKTFALPRPIRGIYLVCHKDYIRYTLLKKLKRQ